ncbi:hypothetical protein HDK77DRAFT_143389 [Phyllosticta capitalensis]
MCEVAAVLPRGVTMADGRASEARRGVRAWGAGEIEIWWWSWLLGWLLFCQTNHNTVSTLAGSVRIFYLSPLFPYPLLLSWPSIHAQPSRLSFLSSPSPRRLSVHLGPNLPLQYLVCTHPLGLTDERVRRLCHTHRTLAPCRAVSSLHLQANPTHPCRAYSPRISAAVAVLLCHCHCATPREAAWLFAAAESFCYYYHCCLPVCAQVSTPS